MPDFAELQRRFLAATDFSKFWNDFMDNWAMEPGFMRLGAPAETAEMEVLVARIVGKMYGRVVEPRGMRLLKIKEAGLVHGAFKIDGQLASVLYFEGIEKGLIAAPADGGGDNGKTHYARFAWQFGGRSQFVDLDERGGGSGLPN